MSITREDAAIRCTVQQPYTRERFTDTYDWMVSWDMVPGGATYEDTVDNRAWADQ